MAPRINLQYIALLIALLLFGESAAAARLPDGEKQAYKSLLQDYQAQELKTLVEKQRQFADQFSKSHFADNALYLTARLHLEKGHWNEALPYLNQFVAQYPNSERLPSVLYGKGLVFKQKGQLQKAKVQWKLLLKRFPGSQESQKAWVGLRLLNQS